jgi:Spy/CpxP family protein refolding chaperone
MAAHVDKMIEQFAADASPDQKSRLSAIARAALTDLAPVHAQLRAEQMQRMDLVSRRILAAVEDAVDVLTPEQRARLAEHLHSHMH